MNIQDWYKENFNRMVTYVRNPKRGGDGLYVEYEDAVDIVNNVFMYFSRRPDKWKAKWVWNKLKQQRQDFMRHQRSYGQMKKDLFEYHEAIQDESMTTEEVVDMYETSHYIQDEIDSVRNPAHRKLLNSHLVDGEPLHREDVAARKMISRFKKKMIDKYGEGDE